MEAEDQHVQLAKYALQYFDVKKYNISNYVVNFISICKGEVPLELCFSAPYFNEIVERFFNFVKVVKIDWRSKLSEENIEALLRVKVEAPGIE